MASHYVANNQHAAATPFYSTTQSIFVPICIYDKKKLLLMILYNKLGFKYKLLTFIWWILTYFTDFLFIYLSNKLYFGYYCFPATLNYQNMY